MKYILSLIWGTLTAELDFRQSSRRAATVHERVPQITAIPCLSGSMERMIDNSTAVFRTEGNARFSSLLYFRESREVHGSHVGFGIQTRQGENRFFSYRHRQNEACCWNRDNSYSHYGVESRTPELRC